MGGGDGAQWGSHCLTSSAHANRVSSGGAIRCPCVSATSIPDESTACVLCVLSQSFVFLASQDSSFMSGQVRLHPPEIIERPPSATPFLATLSKPGACRLLGRMRIEAKPDPPAADCPWIGVFCCAQVLHPNGGVVVHG